MSESIQLALELEDILTTWLERLRAEVGLAATTFSEYRRTMVRFLSHMRLGTGRMAGQESIQLGPLYISQQDVAVYLVHLRQHHSMRARVVGDRFHTIRRFLTDLVNQGDIASNPADGIDVATVLNEPIIYRTLAPDEIERLLERVSGDGWLDVRHRAIIHVLLHGVRSAELRALDLGDVGTGGTLRVGQGDASRVLQLDEEALKAVRDWVVVRGDLGDPEHEAVFVSRPARDRISERAVEHRVLKHARAAGFDEVNTATLRHTFVRRSYERGLDREEIRILLGRRAPPQKGLYGIVDEPRSPTHCSVCGVEVDKRSTRCRRHAAIARWKVPGFKERWLRAREAAREARLAVAEETVNMQGDGE